MVKRTTQQLLIAGIAIFVMIFAAEKAQACSCGEKPTINFAEKAPSIVILKLQSVEKEGASPSGAVNTGTPKLIVEKVFKGNLKVGQEIKFSLDGICIWSFNKKDIGTEYLFYLKDQPKKDGLWDSFWCSRSGRLTQSGADLLYLEKIEAVRGKTRLSGNISFSIRPTLEGEGFSDTPLSEQTINIVGNGKNIKVKTDRYGAYEIYDLPPGLYNVIPPKVFGYEAHPFIGDFIYPPDPRKIRIKPNEHTELHFKYRIFNSVSGKLFDDKQRPLPDACLRLIPVDGKPNPFFYNGSCTDKDGDFKFKEITPGTYIMVVNENGEITPDAPFKTFYYSGTTVREKAEKITVKAGQQIDGITLQATPIVETVTISGRVIFEDGKIPDKANDGTVSVKFAPDAPNSDATNKDGQNSSRSWSVENGKFSFRVYKGQKGRLFAELGAYVGLYENCPKLDKLVKAKGGSYQDLETNAVIFDSSKHLKEIVLKFPFPGCKKAKEKVE